MAPVALAFAVLDTSGSATDLGVVLAARMVPLLAFLLVGGAVADRFSRRVVLIVSDLGSALTQGAVAVLLLLTHNYALGTVAVLELLNGLLTAFTTPALRGVVPELAGREQLRQTNSLLGTVKNATKVLGPSASGLLVVAVGSGWAIGFDAITFLAAAGCLARLPLSGRAPSRKSNVLGDICDGWVAFRRIRWVWVVTVSFGVVNLAQTGTWQILGPQLTQELSNKAAWGFVLSARGVGLLLMDTLMYRITSRHLLRFGLAMGVLGSLPFVVIGAAVPLLSASVRQLPHQRRESETAASRVFRT
jgi:MFS family permease